MTKITKTDQQNCYTSYHLLLSHLLSYFCWFIDVGLDIVTEGVVPVSN